MYKPLISIIIPTFNRVELIKKTLDSVLNQTYENWECIIVDDDSDEETEKAITDSLLDKRIKFLKRPTEKNNGASSCRNYGLELAKGELIQFLDDDDLLGPGKLEEQVKIYSGGSEVLTCKWGGFSDITDLNSKFKYKLRVYRNFKKGINLLNTFGLYDEYFPMHVYLIPANLIRKSGGWNEELTNNDDAEFFARVILNAGGIRFVPSAKVYYRYGSHEKLSAINSMEKAESVIKSWKLIEENILKKNARNSLKYVRRGKDILYEILQKQYPEVLIKEHNFFKDRNSYGDPGMNLYKRIKSILSI